MAFPGPPRGVLHRRVYRWLHGGSEDDRELQRTIKPDAGKHTGLTEHLKLAKHLPALRPTAQIFPLMRNDPPLVRTSLSAGFQLRPCSAGSG
jgi:hypothetical protein